MNLLIVLSIGFTMLVLVMMAARAMRQPNWRRCRFCKWWYDGRRLTTTEPEGWRNSKFDIGICPDCHRKQKPPQHEPRSKT